MRRVGYLALLALLCVALPQGSAETARQLLAGEDGSSQMAMVKFSDIDPADKACKADILAFCSDLIEPDLAKTGDRRKLQQLDRTSFLRERQNAMLAREKGSGSSSETGPGHQSGLFKKMPYLLNKQATKDIKKAQTDATQQVSKEDKSKFETKPNVKNYLEMFKQQRAAKKAGQGVEKAGTEALAGLKAKIGAQKEFKATRYSSPIAHCLRETMTKQTSEIAPDATKMSLTCRLKVRKFFRDQAEDVRKDPPLFVTCAKDIAAKCNNTMLGKGRVLRCLKANKLTLEPKCAQMVSKRQEEAAEDVHLDTPLAISCEKELTTLCNKTGEGQGFKIACLKSPLNKRKLSQKCFQEVFRRKVEDAEDVRFDYQFAQACANDVKEHCEGMTPGSGKAIACLYDAHRKHKELTADCKAQVTKQKTDKTDDWRQNFKMRMHCYKDVKALCPEEFKAMPMNNTKGTQPFTSSVRACLFRKRAQIQSKECEAEVSHDIVDQQMVEKTPYQKSCQEIIQEKCKNIKAGVVLKACLKRQEGLTEECKKDMAEDTHIRSEKISLRPGLATDCASEIKSLCPDVKEGDNRIAACLNKKLMSPQMSDNCRKSLRDDKMVASENIFNQPEIYKACKMDMRIHCGQLPQSYNATGGKNDQGKMLRCLQDHRNQLRAMACTQAVVDSLITSQKDWLADHAVHHSCKNDVRKYCKDEAQEFMGAYGKVHGCLRKRLAVPAGLSPACAKEQQRLVKASFEDIRMQPYLHAACSDAVGRFCEKVEPGKGRVVDCLVDSAARPGFPEKCSTAIKTQLALKAEHIEYNPKIKTACADQRRCMHVEDELQMECLANNFADITWGCRSEFTNYLGKLFKLYEFDHPITQTCDAAVTEYCDTTPKSIKLVDPGFIPRCLLRQFSKLGPKEKKCATFIKSVASVVGRDILDGADEKSSMADITQPDMSKLQEVKVGGQKTEKKIDQVQENLNAVMEQNFEMGERTKELIEAFNQKSQDDKKKEAESSNLIGPFAAFGLVAFGMVLGSIVIYNYKAPMAGSKGVVYVDKY
mmetsp:Transcript_42131/g.51151  ORF Transcript_42131/g.51151 Transcript_42131/m.51151 type:complete len:1045 (-) Transcript_42131:585-3719(-)|eukprot:CAMPEP_0197845608 /NCGR_PEP_ID=MMETSP1438-20131217/2517_1 /TAXON_ID=1461541 /ORGANISM="Pterosperma sp., Strain CCMP1384" /LENGTH=1044 /DNA_ID=CAMNT_0043456973 /DNA_START=297 /DNA_END=3431 /DNA_ORIENTATION=+